MIKREIHKIDASNEPLGRLATKIVFLLRGKHKPSFLPNMDGGDFVEVDNIERVRLTGGKVQKEIRYSYSGYPGGLKKIPLKKIFKKDPAKVLRIAVWGMLPKNKLRAKIIKRLKIK